VDTGRTRSPPRVANECPTGFYSSEDYCKCISNYYTEALPELDGNKCPTRWYRSGAYCVKQQPDIALARLAKKIIAFIEILEKIHPLFHRFHCNCFKIQFAITPASAMQTMILRWL
jgi:hypothetical protein